MNLLFILGMYCFYFTSWDLVAARNYGVFKRLEQSYGQFAGVEGWLDWIEAQIVYVVLDSNDRLWISWIYFMSLLGPRD